MKRKVTLHDIAKRLNLSATTISLALRDHPRISTRTKEKVRLVLKEMRYEPDQVARALVTGRSNLVGVIVPNSNDPYYAEVFRGIEDAARAANYHVLLINGSYDLEAYADHVKDMIGLRVGGLIAAPPFMSEKPKLPQFWRELESYNFHVVLVNRQLDPPIFHQVAADYHSGVRMAVESLAALKHRRVAYISGEPALLPIKQRLAAFRRFANKHGFLHDPALFECCPLTAAGGYESCRRLWTNNRKKPTAIVAFSDTVAIGALRFLHEQDLQIPRDVSVIGFDGIIMGNFTNVSLSTISTPMYEIGKQAFDLLLGSIHHNPGLPQSMILPVRLLLRESVGPAPPSSRN
ncbi:MAG: LacI family DNA-binding transcriptional regulator [Terriglobia bacterium]